MKSFKKTKQRIMFSINSLVGVPVREICRIKANTLEFFRVPVIPSAYRFLGDTIYRITLPSFPWEFDEDDFKN